MVHQNGRASDPAQAFNGIREPVPAPGANIHKWGDGELVSKNHLAVIGSLQGLFHGETGLTERIIVQGKQRHNGHATEYRKRVLGCQHINAPATFNKLIVFRAALARVCASAKQLVVARYPNHAGKSFAQFGQHLENLLGALRHITGNNEPVPWVGGANGVNGLGISLHCCVKV